MTNQASSYPFQATFVKTFHRGLLSGIRIEETLPLVSYIDPAVFAEQFNKHDLDYKVSDVEISASQMTDTDMAQTAVSLLAEQKKAETEEGRDNLTIAYQTICVAGCNRFGSTFVSLLWELGKAKGI